MERDPSGTVRPKHINIQRHMLTSSKAYKGTIRSIFKYKYTSSQMYKRTNGNIHSPHLHPRDRSQDWAKILSFFLSFRSANTDHTNISYFSSNQIQIRKWQVLWRSIHGMGYVARLGIDFSFVIKNILHRYIFLRTKYSCRSFGYQLNTKSVVRSCKYSFFLERVKYRELTSTIYPLFSLLYFCSSCRSAWSGATWKTDVDICEC